MKIMHVLMTINRILSCVVLYKAYEITLCAFYLLCSNSLFVFWNSPKYVCCCCVTGSSCLSSCCHLSRSFCFVPVSGELLSTSIWLSLTMKLHLNLAMEHRLQPHVVLIIKLFRYSVQPFFKKSTIGQSFRYFSIQSMSMLTASFVQLAVKVYSAFQKTACLANLNYLIRYLYCIRNKQYFF